MAVWTIPNGRLLCLLPLETQECYVNSARNNNLRSSDRTGREKTRKKVAGLGHRGGTATIPGKQIAGLRHTALLPLDGRLSRFQAEPRANLLRDHPYWWVKRVANYRRR